MILHPVLSDNTITSLHPSAITAAVCAEVIFANTSPFWATFNRLRTKHVAEILLKQLLCLNNTSWCMSVWIVWYGCVFCLYVMHLYVSSHGTTQMKHHQVLSSQSAAGKYHPKKHDGCGLFCFFIAESFSAARRNAKCALSSMNGFGLFISWMMTDMTRYDKM